MHKSKSYTLHDKLKDGWLSLNLKLWSHSTFLLISDTQFILRLKYTYVWAEQLVLVVLLLVVALFMSVNHLSKTHGIPLTRLQ